MAEALLQNQTLLAAVIAELPLALLACDVTGRVTHYNRAAVELFGFPQRTPPPRPAAPTPSHPGFISWMARRRYRPRTVHWRARCAVRRSATPSLSSLHRRVPCARRSQARGGWSDRPDRHSARWRWSRTSPNGASLNRSSSRYTSNCWLHLAGGHGGSGHQCPAQRRQRTQQRERLGNLIAEGIKKSKCAGLGGPLRC